MSDSDRRKWRNQYRLRVNNVKARLRKVELWFKGLQVDLLFMGKALKKRWKKFRRSNG